MILCFGCGVVFRVGPFIAVEIVLALAGPCWPWGAAWCQAGHDKDSLGVHL